MTYDGGKNGEGVYQTIINQMPPHRVYIEAFLGSGAVIRRKRPAAVNIGIEKDPVTLAAVKPLLSTVDVLRGDALTILPTLPAGEDVLIYADPPYLMETRSCQRNLYRCEFGGVEEHTQLIKLLSSTGSRVSISGYRHPLYDDLLTGWRRVDFQAMTRRGSWKNKLSKMSTLERMAVLSAIQDLKTESATGPAA